MRAHTRIFAAPLCALCALSAVPGPSVRAAATAAAPQAAQSGSAPARVGSKNFTESLILADILQLVAQRHGLTLVQRRAMGGSAILWQALLRGAIDVYPEYSGTLTEELLHGVPALQGLHALPPAVAAARLRSVLAARGLGMSASMGFEDRYALAVSSALAARLHLASISDLRAHPQLRYALSNEFMRRADGWPGLRAAYGLDPRSVRGMDHTLAYLALRDGAADVVDVYTTDAEIQAYRLTVLRDDRGYFPSYQAVWLYRRGAVRRWPALLTAMQELAGRISVQAMRNMNAQAQIAHRDDRSVAADFVATLALPPAASPTATAVSARAPAAPVATSPRAAPPAPTTLTARLLARTREHLVLVGISLGLALLLGLPLGVIAAKLPALGRPALGLCVVLQTVPSLAMLVFMIPLFGIGARPAIAALFLYSLLPIVRNTITGLHSIPAPLVESAASLGLPRYVRLLRIELPLAMRTIIAGISTAAVINVGTATLGALIGAGGYGEPILTGIRLDDLPLILEGAIPAALLALLVMAAFQLLERALTPRGLREFLEG
jgi:osmoprotectant transport system substrate-binding protein/osmoprotectant transport system permease protein